MNEVDREEARGVQRILIGIFGGASLVTLPFAIMAYTHAPRTRDLYHLVYGEGVGSPKPESTLEFLFIFPCFLMFAFVLQLLTPARVFQARQQGSRFPVEGRLIFAMLWTSFFLFGSLHRSWTVLHQFR